MSGPLSDPHNCAQFRFSTTRGYSDNIERERARARQGARTDLTSGKHCPEVAKGPERVRDKVASAIGIGSGRTYDKAAQVWEAAKAGDEVAQKAVQALDEGKATIHKAYRIAPAAREGP